MKTKDGLWRLSPSSLYKYTDCKSCFWVNNHYRQVPGFPPVLNMAMDSVLKARYDAYRTTGTFPPESRRVLEEEKVKPFEDIGQLHRWREDINALRVVDEKVGYMLVGKIDDVLVEADGRLIPADYKSSGNAPADDKQKYYVDQLAAYGFMFRKHGYEVSNRAYLLHYFVKDKHNPSIKVEFSGHVDRVDIDVAGLERTLAQMVELLNGDYPGHNPECKICLYVVGRDEVVNSS